jgi:PAS domain-containing protein
LFGLPFLLVELFPLQLYRVIDVESYLVFHNIAEFFGIILSLSIFGVGWFTYGQSGDRHTLFLATAFLAIGLMNTMHTLGYAGMPAFITPNSANKSTQFWIAVRIFTAAAFMFSAFISPDNRSIWLSKPILITGSLVSPTLVFIAVIFFPDMIPSTFIEGTGLTPFKKICEYLVITLLILAFAAYWRRLSKTRNRLFLFYLAAFILCIFSELVFVVYKSVFDTYNILGHTYKVFAFCLIYQGIFVASVKNPYLKLLRTEKKLELDISERLRAEEAQREGERKLRLLSENIEDVFWEGVLSFNKGDTLVLYSDGLLDALPDLNLSNQAIAGCLDRASGAEEMMNRLSAITEHQCPLSDDLTMQLLHCNKDT